MRRTFLLLVTCGLLSVPLSMNALPAGAQAGDVTSFCAARVAAENAGGKGATRDALDDLQTAAPAAIQAQVSQLADLFAKKGFKAFENKEGSALIVQIDAFVFANCGFNTVSVTAIDYEFQNVPATIPKGTVAINFANAAPEEEHEMVVFKLKPGFESVDPEAFLALPEKKARKQAQFALGMFAPAGQSSTSVGNLEPGAYIAACFIPVGGKKNGAPHFQEGMYATFEVPA